VVAEGDVMAAVQRELPALERLEEFSKRFDILVAILFLLGHDFLLSRTKKARLDLSRQASWAIRPHRVDEMGVGVVVLD